MRDLEIPPVGSIWTPTKGPQRIVTATVPSRTEVQLVKFRCWHETTDAYGPHRSITLAQWLRWVRMLDAEQMEVEA